MRLTERINKLEQRVLPNQLKLVWADNKDDIPTNLTGVRVVCWQSNADEIREAINELKR